MPGRETFREIGGNDSPCQLQHRRHGRAQNGKHQVAGDSRLVQNDIDRDSEQNQKDAVIKRQLLPSCFVRKPSVEVIAEKSHEQREAIDQTVRGVVEASPAQIRRRRLPILSAKWPNSAEPTGLAAIVIE